MGQVRRFGSFRAAGLFGVVRHGLSGRASPQVSRSRYTDGERRHRIGWHRGSLQRCRVHRGASLLRRLARASPPGPIRTFRSQAWQQKKNTCTSGCCERRGRLGKSPRSSGPLATLGQRRAAGAPIAESGTAFGLGSIIDCPSVRSPHEAVPTSRSSRPSGRLSSPSGPAVGHRRAALRVVRHVGARADVSSGAGSFERPYNHRLHLTAPRGHLSHPARGERV